MEIPVNQGGRFDTDIPRERPSPFGAPGVLILQGLKGVSFRQEEKSPYNNMLDLLSRKEEIKKKLGGIRRRERITKRKRRPKR